MKLRKKRQIDNDVDIESMLSNLDRLKAVADSGLLVRPERPGLDALVATAKSQLKAAMAWVSVVDNKQHFVASSTIFSDNPDLPRSYDLDYSYCKYVVATDDVLAVENSLNDDLVRKNLSTTEYGLRSYLGVPLKFGDQVIGSFCVANTETHEWTTDELDALEVLASKATAEINH